MLETKPTVLTLLGNCVNNNNCRPILVSVVLKPYLSLYCVEYIHNEWNVHCILNSVLTPLIYIALSVCAQTGPVDEH